LIRVRDYHEGAVLLVKAGDLLVKSIKKKVLTPGEMIDIKIKKSDLPAAPFKTLIVELTKGGK